MFDNQVFGSQSTGSNEYEGSICPFQSIRDGSPNKLSVTTV
jgi:hypothetical protein